MPTVKIPPVLRAQTAGNARSPRRGTVGEALRALADAHPGTRHSCSPRRGPEPLRQRLPNDEDVRVLDGLDTAVADDDRVVILPAMAGGGPGLP